MKLRQLAIAALVALPVAAWAETPNITPGSWEFVSTTTVTGDMPIPDQTDTEQQCITQEDLDEIDARLRYAGEIEGGLSEDRIPEGTPLSHWWWWYPAPPPSDAAAQTRGVL